MILLTIHIWNWVFLPLPSFSSCCCWCVQPFKLNVKMLHLLFCIFPVWKFCRIEIFFCLPLIYIVHSSLSLCNVFKFVWFWDFKLNLDIVLHQMHKKHSIFFVQKAEANVWIHFILLDNLRPRLLPSCTNSSSTLQRGNTIPYMIWVKQMMYIVCVCKERTLMISRKSITFLNVLINSKNSSSY